MSNTSIIKRCQPQGNYSTKLNDDIHYDYNKSGIQKLMQAFLY